MKNVGSNEETGAPFGLGRAPPEQSAGCGTGLGGHALVGGRMTAPAGVNEGSGTESAQVSVAEPESAEAGGPIAEDSREQSPETAAEPDAAVAEVAEVAEPAPVEPAPVSSGATESDEAELAPAETE